MFSKVLVANRGEIARRIIRSLREMNISSVAVYSDVDSHSLHVEEADEAIMIGDAQVSESYGNYDAILNAITKSGANAVHPGYGFLAENYSFAAMVESAGIAFIGPSSESIKRMGDKIQAKQIAFEAGLPILGKCEGSVSRDEIQLECKKIGFPVIIKASAGGGGKGMRIVNDVSEVLLEYDLATSEALKAFGDGSVFVEKYLEKPRHIEIQVLADKFGNVVCLGERECSIQRRHQKIIEEAPSPSVSLKLRKRMEKACVALVKRENYFSAGTVEFLLDEKGNFYFLEMNTRIQVEHPVTEMTRDVDIVQEMIRISANLPISDAMLLNPVGWAFEARLCAEDPEKDFSPSCGRIKELELPENSNTVRVDAGIKQGDEITAYYDSMIAKICTKGQTREEAAANMRIALSRCVVNGLKSNLSFLGSVFSDKDFLSGKFSTAYVDEKYPEGYSPLFPDKEKIPGFVAVALHQYLIDAFAAFKALSSDFNYNKFKSDFSNNFLVKLSLRKFEEYIPIQLHFFEHNKLCFSVFDKMHEVLFQEKKYKRSRIIEFIIDREPKIASVIEWKDAFYLSISVYEAKCHIYDERDMDYLKYMPPKKDRRDRTKMFSPITGMVSKINVKDGDSVKEGDVMCIISAMKMENAIRAEFDAVIYSVEIKEGATTQAGDILFRFHR